MSQEKLLITNDELMINAGAMAVECVSKLPHLNRYHVYGVPRGGVPASYLFLAEMQKIRPKIKTVLVTSPHFADVIIDDIIGSGKTRKKYRSASHDRNQLFLALVDKQGVDIIIGNKWVVFPWEHVDLEVQVLDSSADDIVTRLLQYIGEDVNRDGLKETPQRFLKAWDEYTSGYKQDPADILKTFEDDYDEMVLVKNIPLYSHCEHHLAPFFGVAHVAYIPDKRVVGLSKIPRLVDIFAKRLQIQERLTSQIADALTTHLRPKGVGVVLECRHFCMECRGVKLQGISTITSKMTGVFMDEPETRKEFFDLIK